MRNCERTIDKFLDLIIGATMRVELGCISPSQPDDYRDSFSKEPIEVYHDCGRLCIGNGNHRFYTARRNNWGSIAVIKLDHPGY